MLTFQEMLKSVKNLKHNIFFYGFGYLVSINMKAP